MPVILPGLVIFPQDNYRPSSRRRSTGGAGGAGDKNAQGHVSLQSSHSTEEPGHLGKFSGYSYKDECDAREVNRSGCMGKAGSIR